jgi:hypothetical protein
MVVLEGRSMINFLLVMGCVIVFAILVGIMEDRDE